MPLASWKKKHYPIPASKVAKGQGAAHSLNKWEGLRVEELKKHGLKPNLLGLEEISNPDKRIPIGSSTCALCCQNIDSDGHVDCTNCSLAIVRGERCDSTLPGEISSPWEDWLAYKDPEPMIRWLKKAVKLEAKQCTETKNSSAKS